jgi:hypothetical protein
MLFLQDPKHRSIEYLGKVNINKSLSLDTYLFEYITSVSCELDKFEINKSVEMWESKLFLKIIKSTCGDLEMYFLFTNTSVLV